MGRIKSALELALERTESVKGDKGSVSNYEAKQQGKKLANAFFENPGLSLQDEIKKAGPDQKEALRQGVFEVLLSQVSLPQAASDMARIEQAGKGLAVLLPHTQFARMYSQFTQALARYLDEADQFEQAIKQQYAPKLRKKEEELARRLGQQVHLDPFQDPEFVAFYNQNMNALKDKYQSLSDQVREQARLAYDGDGFK
ncbi:MAG: hypothetical protein LBK40_06820 [Spirochaetaceae bacterium]|jgi:uncharacterized protein YukE|nr:hypothetical protein [Spirochaetaceae bacterium]